MLLLEKNVQNYSFEGVLGFYKGLKPNLTRVVPACCVTFLVYENVSHYMLDKRKEEEEKRLKDAE